MVTEVECRPVRYPRRRRAIQMVLVLVVFLSGALIGSGGTLALLRRRMIRAQWNMRPTVHAAHVAARMQRRYQLTDEETQRVEQALGRRLHAAAESRQEFLTQFKAARERFLADLEAALPPAKYELLGRQLETKRRRMRWFFGLAEEGQGSSPEVPKTEREQE